MSILIYKRFSYRLNPVTPDGGERPQHHTAMKEDETEPDGPAPDQQGQARIITAPACRNLPAGWPDDCKKLCHRLRMHRSELKLQNDELRAAQAELLETRDKYSDLYDFAPVAYLTLTPDGVIVEANLTFADMVGEQRGRIRGQHLSHFILDEDRHTYASHRRNVLASRERRKCELRFCKKNSGWIWAKMDCAPALDADGNISGIMSVISDITELKQAEEALRENDRFFRTVFDSIQDGVCVLDRHLNILRANKTFKQWHAHQPLLEGKKCHDVLYGKPAPCKRCPAPRALASGTIETEEMLYAKATAPPEMLELFSFPLRDQAGRVHGVVQYARKITERKRIEAELKESEARYRAIVSDQTELICRFDPDGRLTFVNNAYCNCFEVNREEIIGTNFLPHIYEEDIDIVRGHLTGLDMANPVRTIEHRVVLSDGEIRWQQWTARAIFDEHWHIVEYQAVGRDITDLKLTQESLLEAQRELEQRVTERTAELENTYGQLLHAEKLGAVGRLSASIAHEFNNPLFGILNVLNGIRNRAVLDEIDAQLVDMAVKECHRMKTLIQNLQSFNRPSAGIINRVDLHETMDNVLLLARKELKNRRISVERHYSEALPCILAVPDQLKQVVLNLVGNACDACEGGGCIRITTEIHGDRVALHFSDTGVGIEPENLERIFEPFFTTKPEVKGTGLGLSVSYGIIKRHGGSIEVRSEPGKGSTFTITLPVEGKG